MIKRLLLVALIVLLIIAYKFLWIFDPILSFSYNLFANQERVEVFSNENFQILKFNDLPEEEKLKYKFKTCGRFTYNNKSFIKVEGFERYNYIIADVEIYKFLQPDRLYRNRYKIPNLNKTQYLLL